MRALFLAFALTATMAASHAQTDTPSTPSPLATPGGRFVFGQISQFRRDQFMLDTQTGRLWSMTCVRFSKDNPSECEARALVPIEYLSHFEDEAVTPGSAPPVKRAKPAAK
jgi:hypothetical protein